MKLGHVSAPWSVGEHSGLSPLGEFRHGSVPWPRDVPASLCPVPCTARSGLALQGTRGKLRAQRHSGLLPHGVSRADRTAGPADPHGCWTIGRLASLHEAGDLPVLEERRRPSPSVLGTRPLHLTPPPALTSHWGPRDHVPGYQPGGGPAREELGGQGSAQT